MYNSSIVLAGHCGIISLFHFAFILFFLNRCLKPKVVINAFHFDFGVRILSYLQQLCCSLGSFVHKEAQQRNCCSSQFSKTLQSCQDLN